MDQRSALSVLLSPTPWRVAQMWNAAFHQPIKSISTANNAYLVVVAL